MAIDCNLLLQNIRFSHLFFGMKIGLFVDIFEPEGAVFHQDYEYAKKQFEKMVRIIYFSVLLK